jgi:hypothetical protein
MKGFGINAIMILKESFVVDLINFSLSSSLQHPRLFSHLTHECEGPGSRDQVFPHRGESAASKIKRWDLPK